MNAAPARAAGRLIISLRGGLIAPLEPETGATNWRSQLWGSAAESTAVPFGDFFYVGASDLRRLTSHDPKDGRVAWPTDRNGFRWGRPFVTDRVVYAAAGGCEP